MKTLMILKLIKDLPGIIDTVGKTTKALKELAVKKSGDEALKDRELFSKFEKALELQTKLNEQIENQMKIIQTVLENTQKTLRILTYVAYCAAGLALLAVVLALIRS